MASASKTPNLNLPQWVETEKPERTDFNAAFDALDVALSGATGSYGTWTPVLSFGGASVGMVYSRQSGNYRKIGKTVFFNCDIILTNLGSSSGEMAITGLPYVSMEGPPNSNLMHLIAPQISVPSGSKSFYANLGQLSSEVRFYHIAEGLNPLTLPLAKTHMPTGTLQIILAGFYFTNT